MYRPFRAIAILPSTQGVALGCHVLPLRGVSVRIFRSTPLFALKALNMIARGNAPGHQTGKSKALKGRHKSGWYAHRKRADCLRPIRPQISPRQHSEFICANDWEPSANRARSCPSALQQESCSPFAFPNAPKPTCNGSRSTSNARQPMCASGLAPRTSILPAAEVDLEQCRPCAYSQSPRTRW